MKFRTSGTSDLNFYNSASGGYSLDGGAVYNDSKRLQAVDAGATASRPAGMPVGYMYFDTDLTKPVWYSGSGWVDATGSPA